jgi:hypothetical protein
VIDGGEKRAQKGIVGEKDEEHIDRQKERVGERREHRKRQAGTQSTWCPPCWSV